MHETQHTIAEWADATFGAVRTPASSIGRALREMAELLGCLVDNDGDAATEAADVAICLTRLGRRAGFDLITESSNEAPVRVEPLTAAVLAMGQLTDLLVIDSASALYKQGLLLVMELLRSIALSRGRSLEAAIDAKMAINRRRQWRRDGHGHGYHLSEAESVALGGWDDMGARAAEAM